MIANALMVPVRFCFVSGLMVFNRGFRKLVIMLHNVFNVNNILFSNVLLTSFPPHILQSNC